MKYSIFARLLLGALSAVALLTVPGLAREGDVTPRTIAALRASLSMDDQTRVIYNAITHTDINELAVNRDILRRHNDIFSNKIKTGTVTAQNASGRCWMFAALNVLRPEILQKHKLATFEFSESYLAFWDKLEKANTFLEDVIALADRDLLDREMQFVFARACMDDGSWEYAVALIKKYGVVPAEAMPETRSSSNTAPMNAVLRTMIKIEGLKLRKLKQEGKPLNELRAAKEKILTQVYRMLVMNYGEPPADFRWRYEDKDSKLSELRTYTPQSFWEEWVGGIDLDQYVQLGNTPGLDFGKLYKADHSRNVEGGPDFQYLNVKIEVLKEAAAKSILDKQPLWFAADVGKDHDKRGVLALGVHDTGSVFGIKQRLSKAERMNCGEGIPNHAMVLMGVDMQKDKPVKWLVENSWGKDRGKDGYFSLYDDWFNEYVYMIVVKKTYVPKDVLGLFEQQPVVLPRWHPLSLPSD